ncbi:hypothetical protein EJD97_014999 [Solanum chilense]|uniref:F-box domain-containing protein n=1 Tax=Solanum chilense TaxID=4083 RepID=A0A6N2BAN7_SOLCI|nr:hypothetical protein EJD97_014999 [Solanum chilense]
MVSSRLNFIKSLPRELLIYIIERIASYTLQYLMRVKLRFLYEVANERLVYHKITLISFPREPRWKMNQQTISFLEMCIISENLEALYRKDVVI